MRKANQETSPPRWRTVAALSAETGLSRAQVRALVRAGVFPGFEVTPRKLLIDMNSVDAWVRSRPTAAAAR